MLELEPSQLGSKLDKVSVDVISHSLGLDANSYCSAPYHDGPTSNCCETCVGVDFVS